MSSRVGRALRARSRSRVVRVCFVIVLSGALGLSAWTLWPLPEDLLAGDAGPALRLEDRHGTVLRSARGGDGTRRGARIDLQEVDPRLVRSFVAAEDRRFLDHGGVDLRAAVRAARDNLREGRIVSGASTLTMQLARLLRSIDHDVWGKVRQALWAIRLERHLSKQEILEQYLNRVPLGRATVGVRSAARLYFDADAGELSLGQAALLAGLASEPARDNPLVDPRRARARRAVVLDRLRRLGMASDREVERAGTEPVLVRPKSRFVAPHFTTWVLQRPDVLRRSRNGTLATTLDLGLQTEVASEVRHAVDVVSEHGANQAAAVVLDNATGGVLAWVGSPDFWAEGSGQVDMVVSPRQPGSTLKPFLYALAFDRGFTPATVLPDIERTYRTPSGPYRPRNYDRRYHGPVRARTALASSFNVPAVELTDRLGVGSLLRTLRRAGFRSLDRSAEHYGLGLSLGNGDVTLLELANGYRSLASRGRWRPYRWFLDGQASPDGVDRLPPAEGGVDGAGDRPDTSRRVTSTLSATLVLDILGDPEARIPGFGVVTPFEFPFPVAVKTGTSRDFTDNWAVGVTERFTVAVWVGNFSGRPMRGVSGVTGAGPLLHRTVLRTAARYPPGRLTRPPDEGAVRVAVCRMSGLLATPDCPSLEEWFAPGTRPARKDDWYDERGVALPPRYARWAQRYGYRIRGRGDPSDGSGPEGSRLTDRAGGPAAGDAPSPETRGGTFRIVAPRDGDLLQPLPGMDRRYATIALRSGGSERPDRVRWWVDGDELAAPRWRLRGGVHVIRARAPSGAEDEVRITVEMPDPGEPTEAAGRP